MTAIIRSLVMLGVFAAAVPAARPIDVPLLRPDSLAGWDHHPAPPRGWMIDGGRLSGTHDSTPLLSGWTLGDFELRLRWAVRDGGVVVFSLPEVPSAPGLALYLKEGARCGLLFDATEVLDAGSDTPVSDGAMHTAVIRRGGGVFSLEVDGRRLYQVPLDGERRFGLMLSVKRGSAEIQDLRLSEPLGEPIFNGRDLSGWWTPGDKSAWAAQNNELVLVGSGGDYLRSEKLYGNFTLSLEYKLAKGGNSGIGLRTARSAWPSGDGMELQLDDLPGVDGHHTMSIYRNVPPLARADRADEWNHVVVKADGRIITAWMNGELVQNVNTAWQPELKHRNLKGWIGIQDHGAKIQVRNMHVLEAPDGLGLDAWYAPRPEPAGQIVLDRLMNSDRLSRHDALGSGTVTRSVEDTGEHVLAEFTGPGALVRFVATTDAGTLACYFDGEPAPRIVCPAGDLHQHVPVVSSDRNPLLTCLTYKRSLKIVVSDAGPAQYRLDYVTFPSTAEVDVVSFSKDDDGIPRGMLTALGYRRHHHRNGTIRQADPFLRASVLDKSIDPGDSINFARVQGAGLVHWLQLHGAASLLASDDLWIEVTVDGESLPAVAAPVRYFFAPRAAGTKYSNFLVTDRDGAINRLAIPFGDGLRINLSNRGDEPIRGVGMTVSIEQAANETSTGETAADFSGRLRLRGVFQPGNINGEDHRLVARYGSGRWIGLVYQHQSGPGREIESLRIDGSAVDDGEAGSLDLFLGAEPGADEFLRGLSGRQGDLAWRYLLLAPVSFDRHIELTLPAESQIGGRLALFYLKK